MNISKNYVEAPAADFSVNPEGDGACAITRYNGNGGDIIIPEVMKKLSNFNYF
jgi:hypothetical protein